MITIHLPIHDTMSMASNSVVRHTTMISLLLILLSLFVSLILLRILLLLYTINRTSRTGGSTEDPPATTSHSLADSFLDIVSGANGKLMESMLRLGSK